MPLRRVPHDELIYTVPEALTPEECALWIQHGEGLGFDEAPVTTGQGAVMRPELRNNRRVMIDAPEAAAALWARLAHVAPAPWRERPAIGLNERFRLYRYGPGERFLPHHDGAYSRPNGERSAWTLMVFLNEVTEGGETRFFRSRAQEAFVTITPSAGTALFFLHPLLHEGVEVRQGITLPPAQVEPKDRAAMRRPGGHAPTKTWALMPRRSGVAWAQQGKRAGIHLSWGKCKYALRTDVMFAAP